MQRLQHQRGFTLIELLIAITLMALMAGLSWRGIDGLVRTRDATQQNAERTAILQTVLAQWQSDLNALQAVPGISDAGIAWDGQVLRILRRSSAWRADGSDPGLWVVAWTRRGSAAAGSGQWLRWQSPALTDKNSLQLAWQQAARWGQNPSTDDQARETPLIPVDQWQLVYFRGNAWTNPLSSAATTATASPTAGIPTSAPAAEPTSAPDAIRLLLDLPPGSAVSGRLTIDWVRPHFSNTKS